MTSQNQETLFNKIYQETSRMVLIYITGKCGKTEDIEDIFQETYMEVLKVLQRKGSDYIKNPGAFVMQIAKRKIYHHYTLLERLKIHFPVKSEEEMQTLIEETQLELSTEELVIKKASLEQAGKILKAKDEVTKKIFYLYYGMNVTIPEISQMLSLTESNVKNKLYRTIRELRTYFETERGSGDE